ncbi:SnoaL-like domain-containing protein [Iamia sp. SCSIO 61187]|uniref:limonene-1,2-epoxide hydrolase family protein n=1 Tax=Iamia sp. SCSIO 61187 TaxID=2722752 RepID=UPI001C63268F|nr:limonene-1,2-epoxide hydrolase family protein [Iamia sp. SCSIO 61187]QYG93094.1 SnoaL-like domain-containing protein [Iamia sp. SCSIO 61187]
MSTPDATTASPAASTTPEIEVVLAFLGHLERMDVAAALDLVADDVVYQNVPLPPDRGRAAVARTLHGMMRLGSGFRVENHNIAANGPVVLTERTDVLSVGRVDAAFWVCGTFEVHDGRITLWRDRFDWVDFSLAWVRGGAKAALAAARARPAGAPTGG